MDDWFLVSSLAEAIQGTFAHKFRVGMTPMLALSKPCYCVHSGTLTSALEGIPRMIMTTTALLSYHLISIESSQEQLRVVSSFVRKATLKSLRLLFVTTAW